MERNVSFVDAIKLGFSNYANFKGRAQRAEYWWWTLFTTIASLVLGLFDMALGMAELSPTSNIFSLATLIPSLAVAWRRMHDIGKSGWWNFLVIVPLIALGAVLGFAAMGGASEGVIGVLAIALIVVTFAAAIFVLVLLVRDSDRDTNQYGPSPKYGSQVAVFD